ncbi:MAG: beta-propeller fold lactonase family protein [Ignavibacteriae bacterium]|nr:beta-propeller fold lactonase family protein [Ignavibacteriota bacterium]
MSGCHVGSSEDQRNKVALYKILHGEEQFSLQSWEDLIASGPHGSVVVAFKASKSHLVFHLNTDTLVAPVSTPHMPRPGFNLPPEQVQTLIRWINEGVPNDFGAVPFTVHLKGKVLVTNQAEDLVCVIDIATNLIARYVQAGVPNVFTQPPHAPHSIAVDRQKQFYYVCLIGAGKVLKYRVSDNALVGEVAGIVSPSEVALTSSGDTAFVAQFSPTQSSIRMIDTRTMTLISPPITHPGLRMAHGMHRSRDGTMIYVTGYGSDNILVLSLADLSTSMIPLADDVPPIPTGAPRFQPYYVEPSRDDKYIYISCSKSNEIRVIDRDSMKVVDSIRVGQEPLAVDITPDNSRLYVANLRSNSVSVIRTSDRSILTTIENVGVEPHGIKVSGDGNYVYVSCRNTEALGDPPHHPTQGSKKPGIVAVIDASTHRVIKRIEVGAFAAGLAIVQ